MTGMSDDIFAGIAGNPRCAGAPCHDMAIGIYSEDAVSHHIQHVTQDSGIFSEIQFHEINGERNEDKTGEREPDPSARGQ
jgi:hypothetical protein